MELGHLERIDPREVWLHEAVDFTPWVLDNADELAGALGIDLELTHAEYPVGSFKLDLHGKDLTHGGRLIVENQLEDTDHGHLGQLLTYAAGTEAATIVWMATGFREEHRRALDWLNESTGEDVRFFGVTIGAARIGVSPPAPVFELAVQPNDWQKRLRTPEQGESGRGALYVQFWTRFLEEVHKRHPDWTRARKAPSTNWLSMVGPDRGTSLTPVFSAKNRIRYELYIDAGDEALNAAMFHAYESRRDDLEKAFGEPIDFESLPNRRAKRLAVYADGDVANTDTHGEYIEWFIDKGERFRHALKDIGPITLPD